MATLSLLWLGLALAEPVRLDLVAPLGDPLAGDEVPLQVVVTEGAQPLAGREPGLTLETGAIIAREGEISPGVWQFLVRLSSTGSSTRALLSLGEARAAATLTYAPLPQAPLSAPPLLVASTGGAPVQIEVTGVDLPEPADLRVLVAEGRTLSITQSDHRLLVTWAPDDDPFPRAVPIALLDGRETSAPPAWTVVQLRAHPRVPVQTEPGSRVSLRVGGRTYGPVLAGADGTAVITPEVRPGEDLAEVLVEDQAGNAQRSALALGGRAAGSLVAAPAGRLVAGRAPPPIYLKAVEPDGRPWRVDDPVCTTPAGEVAPPVALGPGQWRVTLPMPAEGAFFDVRLACALGDEPRVQLRLPVDTALPDRLSLRVWPEQLSADAPVAQVLATLENRVGERVAGEGVTITADLGEILVEPGAEGGVVRAEYQGGVAVAVGGDVLHATWNSPPGRGHPADLILSAQPSNGEETLLSARALDAGGAPLAGVPVALSSEGSTVEVTTDARGWASVPLPTSALPAVVEARAGRATRRALVLPGVPLGADPQAADLSATVRLPIQAGRVAEVFLSATPGTIRAGESATIEVRLLDRGRNPVNDVPPRLEAAMGTLSPPEVRPDGVYVTTWTPPPGLPYGRVLITASGGEGPAEFKGSTTLEVIPRSLDRAPGLAAGVLVGPGGRLSPWLEAQYDGRFHRLRLPVFGSFSLSTYGLNAEVTDDRTDETVALQLRAFPISLGAYTRAEGRRQATWVGAALVVAPYQMEVTYGDTVAVQGPGLTPAGFSLYAGASLRLRMGEAQLLTRYLSLQTRTSSVGWDDAVGGLVFTLGYKVLY